MVNQGDIVWLNLNPQAGHEQSGRRPALIISNSDFYSVVGMKMAMICPITNTDKDFVLHIKLDKRTKTTGVIMCEQVKVLDISARGYEFIEKLPSDILSEVLDVVRGFSAEEKYVRKE